MSWLSEFYEPPIPGFSYEFYAPQFSLEEETEEWWRFETAKDERVCPICAPLDGTTFPAGEIEISFPTADFPVFGFEDVLAANVHPNCRCVIFRLEPEEMVSELFGWEEALAEAMMF